MARYIDLDKAIARLKASPAFPNMGTDGYFLLAVVKNLLKKQPTAAVVEVVRCKDCKYWTGRDFDGYCTTNGLSTRKANDFCSYGERKE